MSISWDSMFPDSDIDHRDNLAGLCDCDHNQSDHNEDNKCTCCNCRNFSTKKWKGYGKTNGPSALEHERELYEAWKNEHLKKIKIGGVEFVIIEKETSKTFKKRTRVSYVIEAQTNSGGFDKWYSGKSPVVVVNSLKKRLGFRKDRKYRIKKCVMEISESVIFETIAKKKRGSEES